MNSGNVELLDNRRLGGQLAGLERRVARGGKTSIDHAPGGRDDIANAAAGALFEAKAEQVDVRDLVGRGIRYDAEDESAWHRIGPRGSFSRP